jgi:2-polyprenyl-3-methyl-5-hydroxy-6-metoxy-1,4-benzoquinol methylase
MFETSQYPYFEDVNWGLLRLWGKRTGLDVLDVGCGYATTSQQIHKLGNRVWGVESNDDAAHVARGRLSTVIEADLQDFSAVPATVGSRKFDVIIFADVLEHLAWPIGVLREYLKLLKDDGSVLVSLPNVGLWSVRFALMFGRFRYEDSGVLDRTHLRFFTRRSAIEMLDAAGLQPIAKTYNPGLLRPFVPLAKRTLGGGGGDPSAILDSKPYRLYTKAILPMETAVARLWPGFLAFQMIFEARPK